VGPRAIMGLEGLGLLKNPATSSGIETAIFRLAAECSNLLHYRVSQSLSKLRFVLFLLTDLKRSV
jgi:hypothetical protein